LLLNLTRRKELPDWVTFEKMIAGLRKQKIEATQLTLPKQLPEAYRAVVEAVRQSVLADWPRLLDARLPARKLFDQTPAFMGRYFWLEDALSEVSQHDRNRSSAWDKLTQGHSDDGTILTLCLCVAAGSVPKTLLTDKSAAALVRKIRKNGWQPRWPASTCRRMRRNSTRTTSSDSGRNLCTRPKRRCSAIATPNCRMPWRCCAASAMWPELPG